MKFKSDIEVQAGLKDSSGAAGTSGQILSSNGTTVSWINADGGVASDVQNLVKAGVAINKGQAVYVTSADGTNIVVGLASNTSEATSSKTLGLLDATVAINGMANVVQIGRLEGLNTSTATVGDPVWLGANGNLIYGLANKPYAPLHLVFIGIVTRVNANNGEIFINVQNGFELNEIHDVDLKTTIPVNGHILGYNGTLWVNKTIAGWLGYTPANDANVVHLTGNESITGNKSFSNSTANPAITVSNNNNGSFGIFLVNTLAGSGIYSVNSGSGGGISASNTSTGNGIYSGNGGTGTGIYSYNGSSGYGIFSLNSSTGTNVYLSNGASGKNLVLNNTTNNTGMPFTIQKIGVDKFTINDAGEAIGVKFIKSGGTSSQFLKADGSVDSTSYQTALTNPITGTGTTNYIPKFTGASSIGNSSIQDLTTGVLINNSITAASTIARGTYLTPTLTATANNDVLVGLDINPTFTNGAFTGTTQLNARFNGSVQVGSGSLTNPSLRLGASSVGIYSSLANRIDFVTNSAQRMSILSNGTVVMADANTNVIGNNFLDFTTNTTGFKTTNTNFSIVAGTGAVSTSRPIQIVFGSTGNVLIQNGGTFTDAGFRLDVNGTARVQGELTVNGVNIGLGGGAMNTNTRVGLTALASNTTGTSNSAFGNGSLFSNTTGSLNTALGRVALNFNTTGANNTSVGHGSLYNNISGSDNVAIGTQAGRYIANGSTSNTITNSSIFIGQGTKALADNQSNQIVIGNNATGLGSNTTVLGNSSTTTTAIYGSVGIGTTSPVNPLTVQSNGSAQGIAILNRSSDDFSNLLFYNYAGSSVLGGIGNSSGRIRIMSGGGGDTYERLSITSGGNVGIGTTNPNQLLHIEKDQNTYTNLRVRNNNAGSSAYTMIGLNSFGNSWGIRMGSSAANSNRLDFVIDAFGSPVERISITSGGNVGIGTPSPTYKFEVSDGTRTGVINPNSSLDGIYIGVTQAKPLIFGTTDTERMRITSGGEVLIGTTSDVGDYKLQVNGRILATDSIYSNGDVIAYASSDIRLKDNILPIKNALEKVKKIGGYTFDWNNKQTTYEGHDVGVIAQEIEAVLPEVVTTRDNGYKAVKYEKLTALLIESIKEQQVQIERLELLINKLTK